MEDPNSISDRVWREALDWLFRSLAHPGDAAEARALAAWLKADRAHAAAYEQAQRLWAIAPGIKPALADRWEPLVRGARQPRGRAAETARPIEAARAGAAGAGRRARSRRRALGLAALAACLVLAVAGGGLLRDLDADYVTGVGRSRQVMLDDSSRIDLGTDTAIAVRHGPNERGVALLHGEAFFSVTHDPARPFVVAAGAARVTVLGTAFEVRRDRRGLAVSVLEGRVSVVLAGGAPAPGGPLLRGQRLRIDAGGRARRDTVPPDTIAAWRGGRLVVDRRRVADVIDEIARYHRGYIVLRDAALGARRVGGVFDLTHPVEAVRAVAATVGARVVEVTPYLLIVTLR